MINREEYTPYGETSFGSFASKRYRFTGKERDEESGLYYHGARYYAPWLARWVSCDPAGMVDGMNLYRFARGSPIGFTDPTGTQSESNAQASQPRCVSIMTTGEDELWCEQETSGAANGGTTGDKKSATAEKVARGAKLASGAAGVGEAVGKKVEEKLEREIADRQRKAVEKNKEAGRGVQNKKQRERMQRRGGGSKQRRLNRRFEERSGADVFRKQADQLQRGRRAVQKAGRALSVAGAVASGVEQYATSTAQTQVGKLADAGINTALQTIAGNKNPVVMAVDAGLELVGVKEGIGETIQTSSRAAVTLVEGVITGDTRGMQSFHEQSLKGEYGVVFQKSSEAGDYWAEKGIGGGFSEFGREFAGFVRGLF